MAQIPTAPKFKVKEFEWFQMETKVRQIIQEVLGPIQKRILQNSSLLNKVRSCQTEDEQKIEEITLMIANDPNVFKVGVFHTVDRRFEQQQRLIEELSRQITEEKHYIEQKFTILDVRMQETSEVLRNVASLRERISKEIELQNDNINKLRTNIEKMLEELNNEIRSTRQTQQLNLAECQREDLILSEQLKSIGLSLEVAQSTILTHKDLHHQHTLRLELHHEKLQLHGNNINVLQEYKIETKRLQHVVQDMGNELRKAEFKIETIVPLITQAQISECLYYVLPAKSRKKVAIYQHTKYGQLNKQVLEKPYADARFDGIKLLEEMQKKNTKEIVQLKRKKLLAMGIDIDHLTYEQREKHYNEISLEQVIDDGDEEVKVNNKVDETQIVKVIELHFKRFTENVSEKVKIQLEDSKKYVYALQAEIRHQIAVYEKNNTTTKEACDSHHTDLILEQKRINQQLLDAQRGLNSFNQHLDASKDLQKQFYNFCSLLNHLAIQDEIDKQNISLMGIQANGPDEMMVQNKSSIVELEKKCFSCCGYPASTISAFKMACLAYNPSPVRIDSRDYRREELLEYTTTALQGIKKVLQHEQPPLSPRERKQTMNMLSLEQLRVPNVQTVHEAVPNSGQPATQTLASRTVQPQESEFEMKSRNSRSRKFSIHSSHKARSSQKRNNPASGLREDMVTLSGAFTEIRRRNITFLN